MPIRDDVDDDDDEMLNGTNAPKKNKRHQMHLKKNQQLQLIDEEI